MEGELLFLSELSGTRNYLKSNMESDIYKSEVLENFYEFANNFDKYYQIRMIDSSGKEIIRIDNKKDFETVAIDDKDMQDKSDRYYFKEAIKLDKDELYISPIDLNIEQGEIEIPYTPVLRIATPLFNSENTTAGILIFNLYFEEILKFLSQDMFIQTIEGNKIYYKSDGTIEFEESSFDLSDFKGPIEIIEISEDKEVHFIEVAYFTGNSFYIGFHSDHSLVHKTNQKIIIISFSIFFAFLLLIFFIANITLKRFSMLIRTHKAITSAIVELAEFRDNETGEHLEKTRQYSIILAKELSKNKRYKKIISNEFLDDLVNSAPLHDIGKVGIRDSILLKKSTLTAVEYEEMKTHVKIGKDIIEHTIEKYDLEQSFLTMGRKIIEYHHEKYDGKGYLLGLKEEEIPLEARIFALVDAYDAIRSKRPYKGEISHKETVKRIINDRGKHFDPDVLDAFLRCKNEFLKISKIKKLWNGTLSNSE